MADKTWKQDAAWWGQPLVRLTGLITQLHLIRPTRLWCCLVSLLPMGYYPEYWLGGPHCRCLIGVTDEKHY